MRKAILIAITSVLLIGCQQGVVFTEFKDITLQGWNADSIAVFDAALTDSVGQYEMQINIRHTDRYPYQNLWLFIEVAQDSITLRRDTIEAQMANERGEWYGGGMRQYTLPLLYLQDITLEEGTYQVSVQQGMREEWLRGIDAVGVKVVRL